ncbi:PREDICTED: programmed cell death protein 1, partial [Condylura cristata]|uniref:programmed cell death protein 1 n=1 Tax=Condylura cristata TaxID=143302 RepID=UPI0006435F9D
GAGQGARLSVGTPGSGPHCWRRAKSARQVAGGRLDKEQPGQAPGARVTGPPGLRTVLGTGALSPGAPAGPSGPPTISPARLSVPEGGNASFTCSLSHDALPTPHDTQPAPRDTQQARLNWYRLGPGNQSSKLAAFPEDQHQAGQDWRFRVTPLPGGRDFLLTLVGARPHDSGTYLCVAIYLNPRVHFSESPHIKLTVTERAPQTPTERPSPTPWPAGPSRSLVVSVASVLAA